MSEAPDREPDLADHPGRRRGRDEVDPELLVLPRPRPRVGPLLALSVLVFCAYFMIRLRSDLVFAHRGPDPAQVDGVAGALAADLDSYVELDAVPDRAATLRVFASDARDGHRLAPVVGSGDRLWLLFGGSHWVEKPDYDERVRGRIKLLDDLPFRDQLVAHLAATTSPRAVDARAALAALGRGGELRDLAGDGFEVGPATAVTVVERAIGEARVTGFATERQPDEAAWRRALERAGVLAAKAPLEGKSDASWSFLVAAPGGVEPLAARLVEAKLLGARAEPVDRTHRAAWRDLRAQGGDLVVAQAGRPPARLAAASITGILVEARRRAPDDARVLVTTDRPEDYWHVTALYGVLGVLALLFTWALWRGLRSAREPEPKEETLS
ncbi:MAG TPA: hypothetical protein VNO33_08035 [Kofleriaceae bacterium]|nr:hypothetical protein [Kofleriaceae bacterium]